MALTETTGVFETNTPPDRVATRVTVDATEEVGVIEFRPSVADSIGLGVELSDAVRDTPSGVIESARLTVPVTDTPIENVIAGVAVGVRDCTAAVLLPSKVTRTEGVGVHEFNDALTPGVRVVRGVAVAHDVNPSDCETDAESDCK